MRKRGRSDLIDELFELYLQSTIPSPPNLSQEDYEAMFSWIENQLKACVAKGHLRFSLALCTRVSDPVPLILEAFCKKAADWSEALRVEKNYRAARKAIVSFLQDCLKRFKALHEGIVGEFHERTCLYHFDFAESFDSTESLGSAYRLQRAKIAEGIID